MKSNCQLRNVLLFLLYGGLVLSFMSGCASVPKSVNMIADQYLLKNRYDRSISLNVVGGGKADTFMISNEEFQQAIQAAILKAELFSSVVEIGASDYRLDVFLGDVKQSFIGLNLETDIEVIWNLSSVQTGKTLWQEIIRTAYTGTTKDAFAAVERMTIASERAAKENIKIGIEMLSNAGLEL